MGHTKPGIFTKNAIILLSILSLPVLAALLHGHFSAPFSEKDVQSISKDIYSGIEKTMHAGRPAEVSRILKDFGSRHSIRTIRIIDHNGRVLSSSAPGERGGISSATEQLAFNLREQGFLQIFSQKGSSITAFPIHNGGVCRRCHDSKEQILGVISVTMPPGRAVSFPYQTGMYFVTAALAAVLIMLFGRSVSISSAAQQIFLPNRPKGLKKRTGNGETGIPGLAAPLAIEKIWQLMTSIKKANFAPAGLDKNLVTADELNRPDAEKLSIAMIHDTLDEKNVNLVKTLQRLSAVHKVALATNSTMELDKVFYNLLDVIMKTLNSTIGYLLLYDHDKKKFQVHSLLDYSGKPAKHMEIPLTPDGVSTWVFKSRRPILIQNIDDTPQFARKNVLGHELKSLICVPLVVRDEIIGTMSVVNKADDSIYTTEDMELLTTIASQASFAIKNAKLYEEQQKVYMNIVHALVSIIDASDSYTRGHSERVAVYSMELAKKINLPQDRIDIVKRAAILHDIGKIGIHGSLLNKEKQLSPEEMYKLRQHPLTGMKILEPLDFLADVSICVGQHHERVDGEGYPYRIPGEKLLLESRILAIADSFDAMTSNRPYRKALSGEEAVKELVNNTGRQHDPDLVQHFVKLVESGVFNTLAPNPDTIYEQPCDFGLTSGIFTQFPNKNPIYRIFENSQAQSCSSR